MIDNKMILKVYDIDYSFIIKNYLDTKLWDKEWTLFVYKKFIVTIKLNSIYVGEKAIWFEIKAVDDSSDSYFRKQSDTIKYTLSVNNINILQKQINSTILKLFKNIEQSLYIEKTEEYYELEEMQDREKERLTKIAEEFLDDNNISNENIRDSYIDAYINNTEKVYSLIKDYESAEQFKRLPDLFLVFASTTKNDSLKEEILLKNSDSIEKIMKELEELKEIIDTEEYTEEMQDNLESI